MKNRFIGRLRTSLFNLNFVMIYIIHKMSVLLRSHLNCLKESVFECFFKEYSRLLFIFLIFFFTTYSDGNVKS